MWDGFGDGIGEGIGALSAIPGISRPGWAPASPGEVRVQNVYTEAQVEEIKAFVESFRAKKSARKYKEAN